MLRDRKVLLGAATGCVVGFFGTYLLVNASLSHRRGVAVLNVHEQATYYLLDFVGGIACAGLGYVLASIGEAPMLTNGVNNGVNNGASEVSVVDGSKLLLSEVDASLEISSVDGVRSLDPSPEVIAPPSLTATPSVANVVTLPSNELGVPPRLTTSPDSLNSPDIGVWLGLNPSPPPL